VDLRLANDLTGAGFLFAMVIFPHELYKLFTLFHSGEGRSGNARSRGKSEGRTGRNIVKELQNSILLAR
jgi:hypothetical protein